MEHLWSYLRRFSRMTKEMRPAHRIDVLAHALLYYAFMSKEKLGEVTENSMYIPACTLTCTHMYCIIIQITQRA